MELYTPPYVLMVDDDEDDRLVFAEVFAQAVPGAKLELLSSGLELLDYLKRRSLPDVIFLDLNMPCMSGFECLGHIRSNMATRNIPVVIYSTSAAQADVEQAFSKGATFFLTKPSNLAFLEKAICQLLLQTEKGHRSNMQEFVMAHSHSYLL